MLNLPEEASIIEKMHEANKKESNRVSFSYAIRNDDVIEFVDMPNRPCYGELRQYGSDSTRPQDYKPGDLPKPIKPGVREAVGVVIRPAAIDPKSHDAFVEYLFSDKSPWRRGFTPGEFEFTRDKDGHIVGVVMWGTDVDPTVMVSLFMGIRMFCIYGGQTDKSSVDVWMGLVKDEGISPEKAHILVSYNSFSFDGGVVQFFPRFHYDYFLPHRLDIKRWLEGDGRDVSNGRTWRQQEDYNRPELQDIFLDTDSEAKKTDSLFADSLGFVRPENPYDRKVEKFPIEKIKTLVNLL